jgi:hypothetical protein
VGLIFISATMSSSSETCSWVVAAAPAWFSSF